MNKCVIASLVLLVAAWQLTECEADGLFGAFGKVTEKLGQKTVQIGQRVKEDAKVVKEKISTFLTGKDPKEHKEDTKDDSDIPVVPPSQPEIFSKLSPGKVTSPTTKKPATTGEATTAPKNAGGVPDNRHQIVGARRCLPTQDLIANECHDLA